MAFDVLGKGVYTVTEAARFAAVDPRRARAWLAPTSSKRRGKQSHVSALLRGDYDKVNNRRFLSFLDLVELHVVAQLRREGFSLQRIRSYHQELAKRHKTSHPFASEKLFIDKPSRALLVVSLRPNDGSDLEDAKSRQVVSKRLVLDFLKKIDYDPQTGKAAVLNLTAQVILDPQRRFGQPIVKEAWLPAELLAQAYESMGKRYKDVADWYNIKPAHVKAAVTYMKGRKHAA